MNTFLKLFSKLAPLLPAILSGIQALFNVFKKKHDPAQIDATAAKEVKELVEHKSAASKADWDIVKAGKKDD